MTAASYIPVSEWRAVPVRVEQLLTQAMTLRNAHEKAALAADLLATTLATWNPDTDAFRLYTATPVREKYAQTYAAEL